MGWHTLRRKTLTVILIVAGSAAGFGLDAIADPDGPLPPVQGHEGAELYSLAIPDEDIIGRYVDGFLAERRDWLQAVLDRSLRFRALIAGAVAERGLPRELQYLPAVESAFNERATSPRGAVGLWQLMRNTASPFGLRMDVWVDERRDPGKATDASIDKLAENHRIFGDWYLALAAYNCGVGKLSGILKRSPDSDYWGLRRKGVLPRETAAFVPQFLALSRIFSYPGRYGLRVSWDPVPGQERIPLDQCVDLRILSRAAGIPLDALASGNPELNYLVTPPGSYHYELKVPSEYRAAVEQALEGAAMPLLEFRVHVVAPGDTLSEMAQVYRVSVEMIQEFNPGLQARALRIGAKVLIPVTPSRSAG
ncbi:MAG: transglycosylase SLT domain-containing protein [Spirochaetia bacterium]|jgi:membrane-bound lytic murein transglycosylase D